MAKLGQFLTVSEQALDEAIFFQTSIVLAVFPLWVVVIPLAFFFDLLLFQSRKKKRQLDSKAAYARKRQNFYRQVCLSCAWAASFVFFAAAVSVTQTCRITQLPIGTKISVLPGQASIVLHWISWVLSFCIGFCWTMHHRTKSTENTSSTGSDEDLGWNVPTTTVGGVLPI